VKLSARPVIDADGNVVAYDGIVEDVTERHRRDELLRRSERMASIGTTLAGVAHELNNPLAAIMGFAQLLLKRPWAAQDRSALETIRHEATRAAMIVKDLLTVARKRTWTGASSPTQRHRRLHLPAAYAFGAAGIMRTLESTRRPMVYSDRAQIEQVMLNLLNNAEQAQSNVDDARATPGFEPHAHDQAHVIIEVEDKPGVPASERSHIWDPFWTTNEGEGTGLGSPWRIRCQSITAVRSPRTAPLLRTSECRRAIRDPPPIAREVATAPMGACVACLDVLVVDPGASVVRRAFSSRGHAVIAPAVATSRSRGESAV
jgi:nitrogen-specific signal transduction histidine kinase